MINELWGTSIHPDEGRKVGDGRVFADLPLSQALDNISGGPDFVGKHLKEIETDDWQQDLEQIRFGKSSVSFEENWTFQNISDFLLICFDVYLTVSEIHEL